MSSIRAILFIYVGPILIFFILGGFAAQEWTNIVELKAMAAKFREESELVVFHDVGMREPVNGLYPERRYDTYEFEWNGSMEVFQTRRPIDLPADGRVRLGMDPRPDPKVGPLQRPAQLPKVDVVVPIHGEDTVVAVYQGLRGHPIGTDYMKAALTTTAAVMAGVVGLFFRRRIRREELGGFLVRHGAGRKPMIGKHERNNIRALGIVHLIFGVNGLFFFWFVIPHVWDAGAFDPSGWFAMTCVSLVFCSILASGVGIMVRKKWALPWMRISGMIMLIGFPIGTAIGIWTLVIHSRLSQGR